MELTPYLENVHDQLAASAAAGGEEARALAERLVAPLEAGIRLALLDALAAAAEEITRELAPGAVELRLRGREPHFVVVPGPAFGTPAFGTPAFGTSEFGTPEFGTSEFGTPEFGTPEFGTPDYGNPDYGNPGFASPAAPDQPVRRTGALAGELPPVPDGEDGATARISFRLPEQLKARVEEAAARAGLSVNAWLVRATAAALAPVDGERPAPQRVNRGGGQRFSGWVR
jgi:hypothetical protein